VYVSRAVNASIATTLSMATAAEAQAPVPLTRSSPSRARLQEGKTRSPQPRGASTTSRRVSTRVKKLGHTQHGGNMPLTPLYKTRLCSFFPAGSCRDGPLCNYAHGEHDLRRPPDFECTSVCPLLLRDGRCTRHDCRYAHQSSELRTSPVMLKTKMCKFFLNGLCVVGEACRFAHSRDELKEAHIVQQERLPNWERRRRQFLRLGQGTGVPQPAALPDTELTAVTPHALAQSTTTMSMVLVPCLMVR